MAQQSLQAPVLGNSVHLEATSPTQAPQILKLDALLARSEKQPTLMATPSLSAQTGKIIGGAAALKPAFVPFHSMTQGNQGFGTVQSLQDHLAETDPLTRNVATSSNTAAAIAGLKPWSRNWVFQGLDSPAAETPLFGGSQSSRGDLSALMQSLLGADLTVTTPQENTQNLTANGDGLKPEVQAQAQIALSRGDVNQAPVATFAMLSDLNGNIRDVNSLTNDTTQKSNLNAKGFKSDSIKMKGASQLSGSEFLSTLNEVRRELSQAVTQPDAMAEGTVFGKNAQRFGGEKEEVKSRQGRMDESFHTALTGTAFDARRELVSEVSRPTVDLNGQVVKGAMSQDRLSSDALQNMTANIRSFENQGGGEMRIHLKPDHLGELNLKVVTQGNHVGLQIQASNDRARKVIEESMSHLKDTLAAQNLNLSKVEVSLAQSQSSSSMMGNLEQNGGDSQQNPQSYQSQMTLHNGLGDLQRGFQQEMSQRQSFGTDEVQASTRAKAPVVPGLNLGPVSSAHRSLSHGRIDVRA